MQEQETIKNDPLLDQKLINLEFASYSDGKNAVAKSANLLFVKYYLGGDQKVPIFTESQLTEALKTAGWFVFHVLLLHCLIVPHQLLGININIKLQIFYFFRLWRTGP